MSTDIKVKTDIRILNRLRITDRELYILMDIVQGLTEKESAKRSYISVDTLKSSKRRLYRKLNASNAAHAVALSFASGLLSIED